MICSILLIAVVLVHAENAEEAKAVRNLFDAIISNPEGQTDSVREKRQFGGKY